MSLALHPGEVWKVRSTEDLVFEVLPFGSSPTQDPRSLQFPTPLDGSNAYYDIRYLCPGHPRNLKTLRISVFTWPMDRLVRVPEDEAGFLRMEAGMAGLKGPKPTHTINGQPFWERDDDDDQ
jgi:hypothetical protein